MFFLDLDYCLFTHDEYVFIYLTKQKNTSYSGALSLHFAKLTTSLGDFGFVTLLGIGLSHK